MNAVAVEERPEQQAVTRAREALTVARQQHADVLARIENGASVTAKALADKADAVTLAEVQLQAAVRREALTRRETAEAMRQAAAERLETAGERLAEVDEPHNRAIADALQEPLRLAREQVQARDLLVSELITDAEQLGAPAAGLNTWSKDGAPTLAVTMPPSATVALVREVRAPGKVDLMQRPHMAAAVGGRGVAIRDAAGRVQLHRLSLDPERAARELLAAIAKHEQQ